MAVEVTTSPFQFIHLGSDFSPAIVLVPNDLVSFDQNWPLGLKLICSLMLCSSF